jgi:hypothetical protein
MSASRKAFEEWLVSEGWDRRSLDRWKEEDAPLYPPGKYCDWRVNAMFAAWEAGQLALMKLSKGDSK